MGNRVSVGAKGGYIYSYPNGVGDALVGLNKVSLSTVDNESYQMVGARKIAKINKATQINLSFSVMDLNTGLLKYMGYYKKDDNVWYRKNKKEFFSLSYITELRDSDTKEVTHYKVYYINKLKIKNITESEATNEFLKTVKIYNVVCEGMTDYYNALNYEDNVGNDFSVCNYSTDDYTLQQVLNIMAAGIPRL